MSRFDAAAAHLARSWQFDDGTIELKDKVWRGPIQGEQIITNSGDHRQYIRIEHDEMFLTLHVPTRATAEAIIGLLDQLANAIGSGNRN